MRALDGFKVVKVFDVSQTDGEPMPEALGADDPASVSSRVYDGLHGPCGARGITVELRDHGPFYTMNYDLVLAPSEKEADGS